MEQADRTLITDLKPIISDLLTFTDTIIPDAKETVRKYADVKFEYLRKDIKKLVSAGPFDFLGNLQNSFVRDINAGVHILAEKAVNRVHYHVSEILLVRKYCLTSNLNPK